MKIYCFRISLWGVPFIVSGDNVDNNFIFEKIESNPYDRLTTTDKKIEIIKILDNSSQFTKVDVDSSHYQRNFFTYSLSVAQQMMMKYFWWIND